MVDEGALVKEPGEICQSNPQKRQEREGKERYFFGDDNNFFPLAKHPSALTTYRC